MAGTGANPDMIPREILPGVYVCADAAELARTAARRFVDWAWQSIAKHGHFNVALSGGSTPRELYRVLASNEFRGQVDWARVHLFWGMSALCRPTVPRAITAWPGAPMVVGMRHTRSATIAVAVRCTPP